MEAGYINKKILLNLLVIALLISPLSFAKAAPPESVKIKQTSIISVYGMVSDALFESIKRRSYEAIENGADYLIYKIGTYGGEVKAADDISKFLILEILSEHPNIKTVAYVETEAISAGSMIAVSCQDLVMRKNTTIGCSAPIMIGQKLEGVEREKTESFVRSTFSRAATANGYPEALLRAMVSTHITVYQVLNVTTNRFEFFEEKDLPLDESLYDLKNKKIIINDQELLTLTADTALEYNIARAIVKNIPELIEYLQLRDHVSIDEYPMVYESNWSEEMVRILMHPTVVGILTMLAFLGLFVELRTPGLGLPGLIALISFLILISSRYMVGMANWVEIAIFILGVTLLFTEIFFIPGFGIVGGFGIIFLIGGGIAMLIRNAPSELPWPQNNIAWNILIEGLSATAYGFIGFILVAYLSMKYLPKTKILAGLTIEGRFIKHINKPSITSPKQDNEMILVIGQKGVISSPLRPSGKAKFGEAIVDVVSDSQFIELDRQVEITEIDGNKILVRPLERAEA